MSFDPEQFDVKKISEQTTSGHVLPSDKIPLIREDAESGDYSNFTVEISSFGVAPNGYLFGLNPSVAQTGTSITSITVEHGLARDSTNTVNIYADNAITTSGAALWGGATKPTGTNIPVYILVSRRSEQDRQASVYLSQNNGGAIGVDEFSVAVGKGLYSNDGTNESISNVVGLYNPIISVQEDEITAGTTPLANGKIILVLEKLS